jgi:hypothetical protein
MAIDQEDINECIARGMELLGRGTKESVMDLAHAHRIVHAINCGAYAAMGLDDHEIPAWLSGICLREMLDAVDAVESENNAATSKDGATTFTVVPDPRLTAAVYALIHHDLDADLIAIQGDKAICVVRIKVPAADEAETEDQEL